MEHCKIPKLLNDLTVTKFLTRKWIKENDLSNRQYSVNKNVRSEAPMLTPGLCYYSDAYIVVEIDPLAARNVDMLRKNVAFKNNASFRSCFSKINNTLIDNA